MAKLLKALTFVGLATLVTAQKRYDEEENDLDVSQAKLAMNRAAQNEGIERFVAKTKQVPLLDTFRGTKSKVAGDGVWKERGMATLSYDAEGAIISVDVENMEASGLEDVFTKMCDDQALYQLQLPEFELITTQNACTYKERGLNETLTFFTDDVGQNLISFNYDVSTSSSTSP